MVQNSLQKLYKNPESEFLCPLILASDKTTLSEIGDLHVDAIFMTTSIFNIKVSTFLYHRQFILCLLTKSKDKE